MRRFSPRAFSLFSPTTLQLVPRVSPLPFLPTRALSSATKMVVKSHAAYTSNMQSTYERAVECLNGLQSNAITIQKLRSKRDLMREVNVLETLQYLQKCGIQVEELDGLNIIHVSGTKGKGSTCAFVESMLRACGLKTGFYSSPHLVHVRERIRIDGAPISEQLFAKEFFAVYNRLSQIDDVVGMPAYFKFLTLLAYHVFLKEKVDVAIIEVGIGGEHDCTNIIRHPVVCGVSTLDIDHTSLLGTTLPQIAWHKAGIFKPSAPAVCMDREEEVLTVMQGRAEERKTSLSVAPLFDEYSWSSRPHFGIAGEHQKGNVALALQLVRLWLRKMGREASVFGSECAWHVGSGFLVPSSLVKGVAECRWPGRSQILKKADTTYYLDGAHTPKSIEMCSRWFSGEMRAAGGAGVERRRRVLIFHCTADRQPATLLPYFKNLDFDEVLFCPPVVRTDTANTDQVNHNNPVDEQRKRCEENKTAWMEIMHDTPCHVFPCVSSAVGWIDSQSKSGGDSAGTDVLVTGSLHLIGAVLSNIQ